MNDLMAIDESTIILEANFEGWLDCFQEANVLPTRAQLAAKLEDRVLSHKRVQKAFSKCNDKTKEAKGRSWLRKACSNSASIILKNPGRFLASLVLATLTAFFAMILAAFLIGATFAFMFPVAVTGAVGTTSVISLGFLGAIATHATLVKILIAIAGGMTAYGVIKLVMGKRKD